MMILYSGLLVWATLYMYMIFSWLILHCCTCETSKCVVVCV